MSNDPSHALATAMAKEFFAGVKERGLDVGYSLIALETFVAVSILNIAIESEQPQPRRYVTEILDVMTENCVGRLNDIMEEGI